MNFLVTMSGGTTQVINATLAGCIDGIRKFYPDADIFIPKPGILGLLEDNIYKIRWDADTKDLIKLPGSSITGTTRIKILDDEEIQGLEAKLKKLRINTFINIGGSGTIKQSLQLSSKLKDVDFIALPKTIDNDLGDKEFKQLTYTPGYLSAIKYIIAHTFNLIRENEGACSSDKVLVSQVFGRDTGHIGAISSLTGHDRVITLFPERPVSWEKIQAQINLKIKKHGGCVVIVPEGYPLDEEFKKEHDLSGQVMWGSSHNSIAQIISNRLNEAGIQSRISNTTIEQRQNFSLIDGNDIKRSYGIGYTAIKSRLSGHRNFFNSIQMNDVDDSETESTFKTVPIKLEDIKDFNRPFPLTWISEDGFRATRGFFEYVKKLNLGSNVVGSYYLDPLKIIEKYESPK